MEAYYSITNHDLTLCNKRSGLCIAVLTVFNINEVKETYGIRDEDLHITF